MNARYPDSSTYDSAERDQAMSSQAYTTMPAKTAVTYIRVSTSDQATRGGLAEGLSIPAQRQAVTSKARSIDAMIVEEFVEAGESGKSSNRPALQRMLEYLRTHRVDVVIVHKIDRLARNRADDVKINIAIRETGAQLVSVAENVDETPQGQLVHGIFSSFAEFYSPQPGHRSPQRDGAEGPRRRYPHPRTDRLHQRPADGQRSGSPRHRTRPRTSRPRPLGLRHLRHQPRHHPLTSLTKLLNDRGLTNRATAKQAERPLRRSHVHRMLTNRYYLGYVTFPRCRVPGHPRADH